jgi:hypothetical protein
MSAAGSLVGRKRDRLAHSPAPKGLTGTKGAGKALERLAAAHSACAKLLANQAYPEPLSELALTLQRIFGAKLVVLSDSAGGLGVVAVAPAKTETRRWLESLGQHHLEGREPTTAAFDLEAGDPKLPIAGIRRFVVVPLNTGRGRGALWLGFADHGPASDDLTAFSILGEHLSLAMQHATRPSSNGTHAVMPNGKHVAPSIKPPHPQSPNELISLAAHELRTPLTPITMLLQSLERKARTGAVDMETILRARKQVARLTTMITDLLDLSRLREDRLVLTAVRVDLGREAHEAVLAFQESDSRHRIQLRNECGPIEVMTDERRLQHMLSSLLDHVAHATPSGGMIEVTLQCRGASAAVTVRSDRPVFGDGGRPLDIAPPTHPRPEPVALGVLLAEGIANRLGGSVIRGPSRSSETRIEASFPLSTAD